MNPLRNAEPFLAGHNDPTPASAGDGCPVPLAAGDTLDGFGGNWETAWIDLGGEG